jgi:hypothetical protein
MGREKDGNPFVRTEPERSKRHNVLILCEGGTELQYFKSLKDNDKYNDLVSVHPMDKIGPDRDDTDRLSMIQIASECLYFNKTGEYPYRYFISFVLSFIVKQYGYRSEEVFGIDKKELIECLRSFRDSGIFKMFNYDSEYVKNGIVVNKRKFAEKIIEDCKLDLDDDLDYYIPTAQDFDNDKCLKDPNASCYLVFDRDYDTRFGRGHPDYDKWMEEFEKSDVGPVVTSPSFELWLYMHEANDSEYGEPSYLPEYETEIRKKILKRQFPKATDSDIDYMIKNNKDKHLSDDRIAELMKDSSILNALKASDGHLSFFKNGLVELKDHPGTMVGDFLRPLLKAFNN